MRILWLTPYLPLPIFGGGTRVFNLIRALSSTCDIDLFASADLAQDISAPLQQLRSLCRTLELVPPAVSSRRGKRLVQLRSLASWRPSQYWMSYAPQMQERINRAVRTTRYDVAIVEHSFSGYYALPDWLPIVLDQHNVESDILRRGSQRERSLARRAYSLLEYIKFCPDEQRICRSATLVLATSGVDATAMQRWPGLPPCVVIPNGVDTASFTPRIDHALVEQPARIVYTATMNYSPNVEAMLYFTDQIWPLIRSTVPHATLQIVGNMPPPEIQQLARDPAITVTGHVPDLRPYIASAQVVVAPLRIGGGTRLKIVEALAMERAVVSTSLGCEGLEVEAGRHLLVADEPARFAASVTELLGDPARRTALGRAGRRLVEERYDWRAIGRRLETVLQELVEQRARAGGPPAPIGLVRSRTMNDRDHADV